MKKQVVPFLCGAIIFLIESPSLLAQITVKAADAPSTVGISFEMSQASDMTINLGQPGTNQYWDFSTLNLPNKILWQVVNIEETPFAARFPNSNLVYKVTKTNNDTIEYDYAHLTETDLTELGRGKVVGSQVTELLVSKRATPKLHLPATFGDANWYSALEIDTTYLVFEVTIVDSSFNQIDGWGTIKTSYGEFPCLRIRQDHSTDVYTAAGAYLLTLERNINYFWVTNFYGIAATVTGKNKVADPNYALAKSVNVMTNFVTSVCDLCAPAISREFILGQNYPNPFNPSTTFFYQLNQPSNVKLQVFNLAGQEVALLENGAQLPGRYEIHWNASHLSSGIYVYRLQMNGRILTKYCALVK